tara:strand:- start:11 stop:202 length:192 start_codon:yes stop_codon:yes gene_type:complete
MADINPAEFLWLKGKVYTLECRIAKVITVLEACTEDDDNLCQVKIKIAQALKGLPVEDCPHKT